MGLNPLDSCLHSAVSAMRGKQLTERSFVGTNESRLSAVRVRLPGQSAACVSVRKDGMFILGADMVHMGLRDLLCEVRLLTLELEGPWDSVPPTLLPHPAPCPSFFLALLGNH